MLRTANPALTANVFESVAYGERSHTMTAQGATTKTFVLLAVLLVAAGWVWKLFFQIGIQAVYPWVLGGVIAGLILALITIFAKRAAPVTAPLYAAAEGLAIGGLSALAESSFPGIVLQAVGLTFGTLFVLLFAYKARIINVTDKFRMVVVAATGGICVVYLVTWILGFFGVSVPFIHGSGLVGIGFSIFVVIVAALNLVLDFDFIERGAQAGVPKYMEWYAAFGLMVTLIWLYIEILRLLSKLRSRR